MERRQVSGYLLIVALVVVVTLLFVSAFKGGDKSQERIKTEQPKIVDPFDNQQKPHNDDKGGHEIPWQGIM